MPLQGLVRARPPSVSSRYRVFLSSWPKKSGESRQREGIRLENLDRCSSSFFYPLFVSISLLFHFTTPPPLSLDRTLIFFSISTPATLHTRTHS